MRLLFFGLSLSSSWGNGHATTYRALLRGLARRGHDVHFLERERPWYAANRDLPRPDFCSLAFYDSIDQLSRHASLATAADAIIVGSFVPEAVRVIEWTSVLRKGLLCFYDIDTPVTLRKLGDADHEYLSPAVMPRLDLYLSFTGGPALLTLERQYGVRCARALYCCVDTCTYRPAHTTRRWDLGYLGTYSEDRQRSLQRLLVQTALRLPERRFVVAGAQYPTDLPWPRNVERIPHVPPGEHPAFYSSLGWALNITRAEMLRTGYSPSVRLFEATACGVPVLSDAWLGMDEVFEPQQDVLTVQSADDVVAALALPEDRRVSIGTAGRARTLAQHTAERRAQELELLLQQRMTIPQPKEVAWH